MLRFVPAMLCTAALAASVVAIPRVSNAAPDAVGAPAVQTKITFATLTGTITGGPGVKLSCAGTTAQVRDSSGKVVADVPTTPNGAGGCDYKASVQTRLALSACAGRVALGAINELGGANKLSLNFRSTPRSVVNGHERLGTLGSANVYSTVANIGAITGNTQANITVGTEP
jgi:hypothetical protein